MDEITIKNIWISKDLDYIKVNDKPEQIADKVTIYGTLYLRLNAALWQKLSAMVAVSTDKGLIARYERVRGLVE